LATAASSCWGLLATATAAVWVYLFFGTGIEVDVGGRQISTAWRLPCVVLISVMSWVTIVAMTLPTAARTLAATLVIWVASLIPGWRFCQLEGEAMLGGGWLPIRSGKNNANY
jgi:hypothetical protein